MLEDIWAGRIIAGPPSNWPKPRRLRGCSRALYCGALGRTIPHTPRNEQKIAGAILACWSLVHGLTLLLVDGLVGPNKKAGALGDSLLQSMLDGLSTKLPTLPPGTWVGPQAPYR